MAEQQKEVAKRTVHVTNTGKGQRYLFDANGKQVLLGPGQEADVEVAEPVAKQLEERSKAGSVLTVQGHDAEKPEADPNAPEVPKEHESRTALAAAEAELMEEGQEADRDRREKDAKKSGEQLARETGIHMHARGLKPEVIAAPADAPPKKK
jgi:tRNA A37 threonylcarbamoyladenosine modification protein TsaB